MELQNLSPFSDIYLHLTQCFTPLALLKDYSHPQRCVDGNEQPNGIALFLHA